MNDENASTISAREVRRSTMRRPVIGSHGVLLLFVTIGLVVEFFVAVELLVRRRVSDAAAAANEVVVVLLTLGVRFRFARSSRLFKVSPTLLTPSSADRKSAFAVAAAAVVVEEVRQ